MAKQMSSGSPDSSLRPNSKLFLPPPKLKIHGGLFIEDSFRTHCTPVWLIVPKRDPNVRFLPWLYPGKADGLAEPGRPFQESAFDDNQDFGMNWVVR